MRFCKKCKGIMSPIKHSFFKCANCGHEESRKDLVEREKIIKEKLGAGYVKDKNIFADYPFKCKKCGYNKSEIIELPAMISDEDTLTYLKCGKCGWTESLAKKIM